MGALNEIEFSEFVLKIQHFSDAINGAPEFPDMLDEVAREGTATLVRKVSLTPLRKLWIAWRTWVFA